MLLRTLTEHIRAQNWFAVWVDFVIVFVGVYVGLQAQEWNSARADRSAERAALERLIVEYRQNLEILSAEKEKSQNALDATQRLLAMIALQSYPVTMEEDLAQTLVDCLTNAKFVPALGSTNSLVASGDLGLIGDPQIQKALTQWPATAQVLIEWQEIERNHGEELIFGLTLDYISWPTLLSMIDGYWQASELGSDLNGLFASRRFEGMLANRRYNTRNAIGRIEALEEKTGFLIERLEVRLQAISTD